MDLERLWAGQSMSMLGDEVTAVALPTIALIFLHASPVQFGLLGASTYLPYPVLGLLVGAWVDRVRRRLVLVAADAARGLAIGSIPVAAMAGALTMGHLLLVGLVVGTASVFFNAAYQAYLPDVVPPENINRANARLSASETAAQVAGPTLAGFLIKLLGPAGAMVADASSFASSIVGVLLIRRPEPPPARRRSSLVPEVKEGLRVVFGHKLLRGLTLTSTLSNLGRGISLELFLLFAYNGLRMTPSVAGVVLAVGNIGAFAGSLLCQRITTRFGMGPTLLAGSILKGLPWVLAPVALLGGAPAIMAVILVVSSFFIPISNVTTLSLRQQLVERELQGRVAATTRAVTRSALPVAALLGGVLAQIGTAAFGPRTGIALVLALGGVIWACGTLLLPHARLRSMRSLTDPQPDPGTVHNGRWRGRHRAPFEPVNPRALLDGLASFVDGRAPAASRRAPDSMRHVSREFANGWSYGGEPAPGQEWTPEYPDSADRRSHQRPNSEWYA